MSVSQTRVVGQYRINGLVIDRVEVTPCYRPSAIGKGIPQYCTCDNCKDRGDLGKTLIPVSIDGKWEVVEKMN